MKIILQDKFLRPRQDRMESATIRSSINKCHETGRINAFKLQPPGGDIPVPHVYWDSDVAKVMEGMARAVKLNPASPLNEELDQLVDLVISAQQEDGYLNTHYTVMEQDERWKHLHWAHELYCAGHLTEAAVAHFEATGDRKFLDTMCRYADYIDSVFGPEDGKKKGYPGYEELELALVRLYRTTGNRKYLDLAKYFVDERGKEPNYFQAAESVTDDCSNIQAHKPVRDQHEAVGHAVRAVYLYSGMADVAQETGDTELMKVCEDLFNNIAEKKMYVTGGIGATRHGEAFRGNYALPTAEAYAESCAAIGLIFFASRMLAASNDSKYADVIERTLYNGAISGLSLSGDRYFYGNPLEVSPDMPVSNHIVAERQPWFGCSCCPTSYCRFLPQLQDFCYRANDKELWIDIPASAVIEGTDWQTTVSGSYPYDGKITVRITSREELAVKIRIPAYSNGLAKICVNGQEVNTKESEKGYVTLKRIWSENDIIELDLNVKPALVYANPLLTAVAGKAAISMGPLVYTFEQVDNPGALCRYMIDSKTGFKVVDANHIMEGAKMIECSGFATEINENAPLYSNKAPVLFPVTLKAVPYALWSNRTPGEMRVFLNIR